MTKTSQKIVYELTHFHLWYLVILSYYSIWTFTIMICISYIQSKSSLNIFLWWYVKWCGLLPTYFHFKSQSAIKKLFINCLIFSENFSKLFIVIIFCKKECNLNKNGRLEELTNGTVYTRWQFQNKVASVPQIDLQEKR